MGLAVDRHLGVGGAAAVGEHPQQVAVAQVPEGAGQPPEPGGGHAGTPHDARAAATTASAIRATSSSPAT